MADIDPIPSTPKPDDLATVVVDSVISINFKMMLILFIVFIVVSSDTFVNRILVNFGGAVDGRYATNYGTILQAIVLVFSYVIADGLMKWGLL